jgi:hypothetical protein
LPYHQNASPLSTPNPTKNTKVGVFVSIVSTKIPFKGAGKEYVGDDVPAMVAAVKAALQACGVQLKVRRRCAAVAVELVKGVGVVDAAGTPHTHETSSRPQQQQRPQQNNPPPSRKTNLAAQTQGKIARQQAAREHQQRKRNLTRYIPDAANAVFKVLEAMAAAPARCV